MSTLWREWAVLCHGADVCLFSSLFVSGAMQAVSTVLSELGPWRAAKQDWALQKRDKKARWAAAACGEEHRVLTPKHQQDTGLQTWAPRWRREGPTLSWRCWVPVITHIKAHRGCQYTAASHVLAMTIFYKTFSCVAAFTHRFPFYELYTIQTN